MVSRLRLLRLVPAAFLAVTSIVACTADTGEGDVDDEPETSADALTSCSLGAQCATLQVLKGRSYLDRQPPNVTRSDVRATIASTRTESTPRQVSRNTSGTLRYTGGKVLLSGSRDGTAEVVYDDFVLLEVLGLDGKVLKTGLLSQPNAVVRVEGRTIEPLVAPTPWAGENRGFRYAPRSIDIAPLLPRDVPFRLRVSVFDFAGVAIASDLFVHHAAGDVPPPVEEDLFSPELCKGERAMPRSEALRRFAPAQSWANVTKTVKMAMRERDCHPQTGCAAWRPANAFPVQVVWATGALGDLSFSGPVTSASIDVQAGERDVRAWMFVNTPSGTFRLTRLLDQPYEPWTADFTGWPLKERTVIEPRFGKGCFVARTAVKTPYKESELVFHAKY